MSKDLKVNLESLRLSPLNINERYRNEYRLNLLSKEEIANYIVNFANGDGGTLYIGVLEDGSVRGIAVNGNLKDWETSIRDLVQEAEQLIRPKFTDTLGIYFDNYQGTPRDSPKTRGSPRPRSSSSPRTIKTVVRVMIRICIDKSKTRYSLIPGIALGNIPMLSSTPKSGRHYEELVRENDELKKELKKQMESFDERFKKLEEKLDTSVIERQKLESRLETREKTEKNDNAWFSWIWH
jgi:hypothetical protein